MNDQGDVPIDDARALAARARELFAKTGQDPLQAGSVRRTVRAELANAAARTGGLPRDLVTESAGPPAVAVAESAVLAAAQSALAKVQALESPSAWTDLEYASLEAIVMISGRPALRYNDGKVETPADVPRRANERWIAFVLTARSKINGASAKVGQVAIARDGLPVQQLGTGWRLGEDLLVTNRHVARLLVTDPSARAGLWKLDPAKPAIVNFSVTDNPTAIKRCAISDLAYCAEEPTVDLAILRLARNGELLPEPLTLDFDPNNIGREIASDGSQQFKGEPVYVVGHPFRSYASQASATVFGTADGSKRCSPGLVMAISPDEYAFEHDCSTLGGNSGSCVLSVSEHKVVGIHYGGANVVEATGMGRANLALGFARLGAHRAATILREGRVS